MSKCKCGSNGCRCHDAKAKGTCSCGNCKHGKCACKENCSCGCHRAKGTCSCGNCKK